MTKRILTVSLGVVLGSALSGFAQTGSGGAKTLGGRTLLRGDMAKVRASLATGSAKSLLRMRVAEVDWDEVALEDVVEWLREKSEDKVNILFRWNALQLEGVDRDTIITLRVRRQTVGGILSEVVDQMSPDGRVTFHGIENSLIVSTKQDLNRKLYLRVYEVTDILFHVPDFGRSAPVVDLQQAARAGGGGGGTGQSIFSGSQSSSEDLEEEEQEVEERIESLRSLVRATVSPDSWSLDGDGSGEGTIQLYDNRFLIVRNTMEVHEQLVGYFSLEE
ncbi:MAG: hypothetical protein IIB57_13900 [Planctomycetes bacterium]|nr:hypothetical protein [Planctomycetota bacterium]